MYRLCVYQENGSMNFQGTDNNMSYFSTNEEMRVSLCTIAYNEESVLNGLFRDFAQQSYPHDKIEIIMVDNASTDGTKDMMLEFQNTDYGFEAVKIVDSTNKNQATAWNEALMQATGDIIILSHFNIIVKCEFNVIYNNKIIASNYVVLFLIT